MAKEFVIHWNDHSDPPMESGQYLCSVLDVSKAIALYVGICTYSKEDNRWSSNALPRTVAHWAYLPDPPSIKF